MNTGEAAVAAFVAKLRRERAADALALRFAAMRKDTHAFLRGSNALFVERLPVSAPIERAPRAWVCGDLHLQNFGSYKGDNRLVYFDINDFDDGALAPCLLDPLRLATSLLCVGRDLALDQGAAVVLARRAIDVYAATLAAGKARWIERATARGVVGRLLESVARRRRRDFVRSRTMRVGGAMRLAPLDGSVRPIVAAAERAALEAALRGFGALRGDAAFFRPLDLARRLSGNASLGLARYLALVHGPDRSGGGFLLDIKQTVASPVARRWRTRRPEWSDEAQRVVSVQARSQAVTPALLAPLAFGGRSFVLREVQASADRVDLALCRGHPRRLVRLIEDQARLCAWGQLRASGRWRAAPADDLIGFGAETAWRAELLDLARHMAAQTKRDWRVFRRIARDLS